MVQILKLDGPISLKIPAASSQQHKQWVPKVISSADRSGGNQDHIGPRNETSVDGDVKHHTEGGPEEVAEKQNKAQGKETEIRAEAVSSSQ
jgi:hypothetical protein